MTTEPTVCVVMLTADRPGMAKRAVECFRAQTYPAKRLLIYDSTPHDSGIPLGGCGPVIFHVGHNGGGLTIGHLRNLASSLRTGYGHDLSDILIHWDDDDYSHPNRIAEQVALLQSSGADAVGYREMLFHSSGGAWLYSNPNPAYALGTSLCYWRRTWEAKPFEAVNSGEDTRWIAGLKMVSESSIAVTYAPELDRAQLATANPRYEPRMIARIHPGNTSKAYDPAVMAAVERQGGEWKRVPEWDSYCRSVME